MKKHFLGSFCLIILSSCLSVAQSVEQRSLFIAASMGGLASGVSGFDNIAESRVVFAFGGSLGIPVSDQVYVHAQLTYFSKPDVPLTSSLNYRDGQRLSTPESVTGTISFSQWIMNFGVLDNLLSTDGFSIEIAGGLTFSRFIADQGDLAPDRIFLRSPVETHTMGGLFGALMVEYRLGQTPLSPFLGVQYDHCWPFASSNVSNYGAFNLSGGMRYYFKGKSE